MKRIDTCGMSCPQPVLLTKNALENHPGGVDILTDSTTAKGNIERFLKQAGYSISVKEEAEVFLIEARK